MRNAATLRLVLPIILLATVFSGCSRDPNVRKQKYLHSGQSYVEKGKYREAGIEFVNALKIDPNYADAHYELAQVFLKTQQPARAYQELVRAVELQPSNYQARIDMAGLLVSGGQLQLAQEQNEWLLQNRPQDSRVHVIAANLLSAQGDVPGATAEMQKAITLAPGDGDLYMRLALLQLKGGQANAAEVSFSKAVELNPKSLEAWLLMGTYHQASHQYDRAEQEFRHAMEVAPKDPEPRAALVRLYLIQGKKTDAEEFLKQVKHDFPDNSAGYRMLGDFYFTTGDLDKAIAEYSTLNEEHPNDLQVKKNYVQILIAKKRYDEARKLNEEILKASPKDNDALLYRGQLEIAAGNANDATLTLQHVLKSDPNNAAAHYQLGLAFQALGDWQNAESEWRAAVRLRPGFIEAQRSITLLAMRQGDMGTLAEAATGLAKLEPTSSEGYALRAVSEINKKQFSLAEEDIHKAIAVDPQSQLGYVQLGNLKFAQKQYSDASKAYQDALNRDPNSTDALRGLINTYLAQNQPDMAVAAANAQIAKAPSNASFYYLLGSVLFRDKKDLSGAEAAFTRSLQLDANNLGTMIQLGHVQAAKGETDHAIATYQQAIKDHPRMSDLYIALGELYETQRNWIKAQDAYQQVLGFEPTNPVASNNLASVMLESGGNADVAMSLAQVARRGMPDSADAADTLGWAYYQKGAYRSAVSMLEEALRLQEKNKAPENADIHYHLGLAYQKTEQPAFARQQLERVLKINPNYREAAEVKKQLTNLKS